MCHTKIALPNTAALDAAAGVRPLATVTDPERPFPTERAALERLRELTEKLLTYHGFPHTGRVYAFALDNPKRRIGCHFPPSLGRGGRITLSRHYVRTLSARLLEDTMRHEIAHALDHARRGTSDHGPKWKLCALQCGARSERTKPIAQEDRPTSKWSLVCDSCGFTATRHRLTRGTATGACPTCCNRHNRGRYDARFTLRVVQNY